VGVTKSTVKSPSNVFLKGQVPYIYSPDKRNSRYSNIELNDFYTNLDLKGGDIIMASTTNPILDNIYMAKVKAGKKMTDYY
jgi:hypothetical protein